MLYDIGRSRTNDIIHAIIGANIVIEHDFSEKVAGIIKKHAGSGIFREEAIEVGSSSKNCIPNRIEEKIIFRADNLINGSDEVNIEFVANKWEKYHVKNLEEFIKRLKKVHEELISNFEE